MQHTVPRKAHKHRLELWGFRCITFAVLNKSVGPFLSDDFRATPSSSYPYPARLPGFLVAIGLHEVARWPQVVAVRKEILRKLLEVAKNSEIRPYLPKAYLNRRLDIVPLRFAWSQLKLLIEAMKNDGLRAFDAVLIKPHSDCPVDEILNDLAPDMTFTVTREPLAELWHRSSVAYVANSSSASTEAVYLGVPVIVHVPENSLNYSPLLGNPQVKHVRNLSDFLDSLSSLSDVSLGDEFFCLDTELVRWRSLLQN